jgi:membrane fusion protein, multidrug efflux system
MTAEMERMSSSSLSGSPYSSTSQAPSETTPPAKKRKMGWVRPILYLLLIGIVGFAVWRIYENKQKAKVAAEKQATALLNRPVPVQAVPVEQRPMPIYQTALGTVTPYYSVTVKARVNGQLDKVNFIEGQNVKAGQTIMVVDPKPFKAALDQAKGTLAHDQALLKNAQAEANRYKALYDAGVVSKETLDLQQSTYGQYEGQIKSDEAAIETAQLSLDWCTIQSPINGKIGLRLVDPGNIITANTTNLVIVNQLEPIAVYFTLPENVLPQVLSKLRADQKLVAEAFDRGDTTRLAVGQLLTSDNQIDTTTGTAKLKAVFSNTDEKLFPNQFVNIHLVLEQRPKALAVPSAAIQTGSQGTFVWVVQQDGMVKMVPVKVALAEGQYTILDKGPLPGADVVVDGADRLHDGAKVIASAQRKKTNADGDEDPTQPASAPSGGKAPGMAAPAPMTAGQMESAHPDKRRPSSDPDAPDNPHRKQHPQGNQP